MENNMESSFRLERKMVECIAHRKAFLESLIARKQQELECAPEGTLRVSKRKNYCQYYWRADPKETNGAYIANKDINIAKRLAQKGYDSKILRSAEAELELVSEYEAFLKKNSITVVFEKHSPERRELIEPVEYSDSQYIERWKAYKYEPMRFDEDSVEWVTEDGVRVRSKSELIIAGMLERFKIPYRYECPIKLRGLGSIRPDFICLNVRTREEFIWEHFGMMDNISYAGKNIAKIDAYEQNGFFPGKSLIMTFETSQHAISSYVIRSMIEQYLS
ncbi:MAG: hypothetical protein K6G83_12515 [Lachnospiraceae bacterium]|nr:hypothetical protein [Lachnospiraceae bacterium]